MKINVRVRCVGEILFHKIGKEVRRNSIRGCLKTRCSQAVSMRVDHICDESGKYFAGVASCVYVAG